MPALRAGRPSALPLVASALLIAAALFPAFLGGGQSAAQPGGGQSTPVVAVAPVVTQKVGRSDEFTGRVEAIQRVEIKARVEGYLEEVAFAGGETVEKGDLLYQIERAPYEANLAQAEAHLAAAQATLSGAQAKLTNENINLERQKTLLQRGTVSPAVVDDATATRDAAAADVQSAEAQIKEAEAAIATARLNLSYTTISAPIDGRIGKTAVTEGNLVSSSSGTMATIVQIDPIRVAFSVPDRIYTNLVQELDPTGTDGRQAQGLFQPAVVLPNGRDHPGEGRIAFVGNEIDPATGTIRAYAEFDNPSALLLPGAFVIVRVEEAAPALEPIVPGSAVLQDRQGPYVFVLTGEDKVEVRRIVMGQRTPTHVVVTDGLTEGETVIVQGVQKIQPGMTVRPKPAAPAATGRPAASAGPGSAAAGGSGAAAAPGASDGAAAGRAAAAPAAASPSATPAGTAAN